MVRLGYGIYFGAEDIGLWAQPSVGFSVPNQVESKVHSSGLSTHNLEPGELQNRHAQRCPLQPDGHHHLRSRSHAADPVLPTLERHHSARVYRDVDHRRVGSEITVNYSDHYAEQGMFCRLMNRLRAITTDGPRFRPVLATPLTG